MVKSFLEQLPWRTAQLIWTSTKNPSEIRIRQTGHNVTEISIETAENSDLRYYGGYDEPSTIFLLLPIRVPRDPLKVPAPIGVSYADLWAVQRWTYLNWLCDVSKTVVQGYLFLYFLGLERHLVYGNFDLAFEEILYLRKYHKFKTFRRASLHSLLSACVYRKRPEKAQEIYAHDEPRIISNTDLLVAYSQGIDLTARQCMDIALAYSHFNRRYIQNEPKFFEAELKRTLERRYPSGLFPFASKYDIHTIPKYVSSTFCNPTLPPEVSKPKQPSFYSYEPFYEELHDVINETHEVVKLKLRQIRKSKKQDKIL